MAEDTPKSATGSKATPLAKAFIRELILTQTPAGYISLCYVIVNASSPAYRKIESPTLIIAGREDEMAPVDKCKSIKSKIGAKTEMKIVDGIGHWHALEAPEQVTEAITKFLTSSTQCIIS